VQIVANGQESYQRDQTYGRKTYRYDPLFGQVKSVQEKTKGRTVIMKPKLKNSRWKATSVKLKKSFKKQNWIERYSRRN